MRDCPTCGRPFEKKGRICASCGKNIKVRHKWRIDGSVVRHINCMNPTLAPPEEGPLLRGTESIPTQDNQGENDGPIR